MSEIDISQIAMESQQEGEGGAVTVTVNVDVEDSTVDDREESHELIENDDMSDGDFGVAGGITNQSNHSKPLVSQRLLQTTHARINSARALEEARGRVKHEDDIWWEQRGHKAYHIPRGSVNKALAHVPSKLHVPTAATLFGQREKANMEKVRPKALPKSSPEACNPFKDVHSKFLTQTTKTVQLNEWKTFKEKQKEEEQRLAEELAAKSAESKKVTQTSEKLLQIPEFRKAHKLVKEHDKREEGWRRISINDKSLSISPAKLPGSHDKEGSSNNSVNGSSINQGTPGSPSNRSVNSSSASKIGGASSASSTPSYEIWSQQMPAYKMYVPPPRPKSPTPCAFGSSTARATTPTETSSRGRSNTPTHSRTERSNSVGSSSTADRSSRNRRSTSPSSNRSSSNTTTPNSGFNGNNGMSRAAEARQRARNSIHSNSNNNNNSNNNSSGNNNSNNNNNSNISSNLSNIPNNILFDRSSPPLTPFDKIMAKHGMVPTPSTSTSAVASSAIKHSPENPFPVRVENSGESEDNNNSFNNDVVMSEQEAEALMEMY